MIIGKTWVWCHIPKTGGTYWERLIRSLKVPAFHFDDQAMEHRHQFPWELPARTFGKSLILTIRRLPTWYASFIHQQRDKWHRCEHTRGSEPPVFERPHTGKLIHPQANFASPVLRRVYGRPAHLADFWLKRMLSWPAHANPEVNVLFIRVENIVEDTYAAFDKLGVEYTKDPLDMPKARTPAGHHYTDEQVQQMYANNPVWAATEERVYGATLI